METTIIKVEVEKGKVAEAKEKIKKLGYRIVTGKANPNIEPAEKSGLTPSQIIAGTSIKMQHSAEYIRKNVNYNNLNLNEHGNS